MWASLVSNDCLKKIKRNKNGERAFLPTGLMRGWSANYVRLGPQTVITFVALEKFRAAAGMTSL